MARLVRRHAPDETNVLHPLTLERLARRKQYTKTRHCTPSIVAAWLTRTHEPDRNKVLYPLYCGLTRKKTPARPKRGTVPPSAVGIIRKTARAINAFRTRVPFRGQTTKTLSALSPQRDCSPKRDNSESTADRILLVGDATTRAKRVVTGARRHGTKACPQEKQAGQVS